MFIDNGNLFLTGLQVDPVDIEGDLVGLVQVIPDHVGKLLHAVANGHALGLTLEAGDGVAVGDIGVEEVAQAGLTGVLKGMTLAGGALGTMGGGGAASGLGRNVRRT